MYKFDLHYENDVYTITDNATHKIIIGIDYLIHKCKFGTEWYDLEGNFTINDFLLGKADKTIQWQINPGEHVRVFQLIKYAVEQLIVTCKERGTLIVNPQ